MALIYDHLSGNYWNTLTGQYEAKTVQGSPVIPHESARPCGCDPGAHHVCAQHTEADNLLQDIFKKEDAEITKTAVQRKHYPVATGVLDYFPDALREIAYVSKVGNDQHNPGEPLHWAREKSTDEADALIRHFLDRGKLDTDGCRHSAKMAWRALALLQKEIEAERSKS